MPQRARLIDGQPTLASKDSEHRIFLKSREEQEEEDTERERKGPF